MHQTGLSRGRVAALAAVAFGVVIVALGGPWGVAPMTAGLLTLALLDRRLLVFSLGIGIPLTTAGWAVPVLLISGRVLDVRLVISFAVAGIVVLALVLGRSLRPRGIEWPFLLLIGWAVITGLLASDSVLTWVPPVVRLTAYYGVLALATRHLSGARDLAILMAAVAVGYVLPTSAGIAQFFLGQADYINDAYRATAPGGRGPIALAFAGQIGLVLSFALFSVAVRRRFRRAWVVGMVIGGLGLIVSATRLVTVTAWAVLLGMTGIRRRWRAAAAVSLFFVLAFAARPDLAGRFLGTFGDDRPAPTGEPTTGENVDASLRFRLFVWSTILDGWVEQPLTGIGPGMTAPLVAAESPARRTAPHNDYIGVFAEMSLPGLALYVAIQLGVVRAAIIAWRRTKGRLRDLVATVGLLFVGINVLGALNNPIYFFDIQVALWGLVGAVIGIGAYRPSRRSTMAATASAAGRGS